MTTKTDELRELFLKMSPVTTFTDHQETTSIVGDVLTDEEVDVTLQTLVAEMREQFDFRTSLDDDTLVAVVRDFYAGKSDTDIADTVGVDVAAIVEARLDLHLFRAEDADAPFDLRALLRLVESDADDAACAAKLDVSESTVRTYRRVVESRQQAQRDSYHYPLEFESILGTDADDELSSAREADRELFAEIKD